MEFLLYVAAFLAVGIGVAHSYLGERYILIRLFRRENLPELFGSSEFTVRTIRLAWHLTTMAWWGFAAILLMLAGRPVNAGMIGLIIGCTFLVHFIVALVGSRGKHFSWPVFLAIGLIAIHATRS